MTLSPETESHPLLAYVQQRLLALRIERERVIASYDAAIGELERALVQTSAAGPASADDEQEP